MSRDRFFESKEIKVSDEDHTMALILLAQESMQILATKMEENITTIGNIPESESRALLKGNYGILFRDSNSLENEARLSVIALEVMMKFVSLLEKLKNLLPQAEYATFVRDKTLNNAVDHESSSRNRAAHSRVP